MGSWGVVGWIVVGDGWMKEEERESAGGGGLSSSNATVVICVGVVGWGAFCAFASLSQ